MSRYYARHQIREAAPLTLHARGFGVTILERATQVRALGVGINLLPQGGYDYPQMRPFLDGRTMAVIKGNNGVRLRDSGDMYTIYSKYVIAADGANCTVAAQHLRRRTPAGRSPGEGAIRRQKVLDALELINGQLNCHGVELGQRYGSTAVIDDGMPRSPPRADSELHYRPYGSSGVRATTSPPSTSPGMGNSRSLPVSGQAWIDAARKIAADLGIDIAAHRIGMRTEFDDVWGAWARAESMTADAFWCDPTVTSPGGVPPVSRTHNQRCPPH